MAHSPVTFCMRIEGFDQPRMATYCTRMQIEKVMKALYVRKLYLWPRFQADIQGNLPNIDVSLPLIRLLSLWHTKGHSAVAFATA